METDLEVHPVHFEKSVTPRSATFDHISVGPMGVGANSLKIVGMDKYFDTSRYEELNEEVYIGLSQCRNLGFGRVVGPTPPEFQGQYGGASFPEDMIRQIQKYDPTGKHMEILKQFTDTETRVRYMYFAMGAVIPWFFTVYLRETPFVEKVEQSEFRPAWTEQSKYFPKLKKFIETSLPFDSIGRVLFFTTFPNAPVPVHRDFVVAPHKDHNINFFFDGWRPSFVYDERNGEKFYLEKGQRSYFFNNRDYHGVDPESRFRYTLRIDGTFNKEVLRDLGMRDGYVFDWSYPQGKKYLKSRGNA